MKTKKSSGKLLGAGILSAIAASLCCITPVLALVAGTSGMAASFSWLEPARPYLIGITVLVLGFAWYQKLKPIKADAIECDCETDERPSFWQSKKFLGIITVFAVIMLAFPYYSEVFYPDNKKETVAVNPQKIEVIHLDIKGMTCESCNHHIEYASKEIDGVLKAKADFKTGKADIEFDNTKTSEKEIINSINETGYTVVEK